MGSCFFWQKKTYSFCKGDHGGWNQEKSQKEVPSFDSQLNFLIKLQILPRPRGHLHNKFSMSAQSEHFDFSWNDSLISNSSEKLKSSDWADIENLSCKCPLGSKCYFVKIFDWKLKKLTFLSKVTSKKGFLTIVSLGRVFGIFLKLVLNTSGYSRYIGPKRGHPFMRLFLISTVHRGDRC